MEHKTLKVKDLLSKLRIVNPEYEVLCYCEDENILSDGHGFIIFEINSIEKVEAEKTRSEDGLPSLKLGKTEYSKPHILIEITSDF